MIKNTEYGTIQHIETGPITVNKKMYMPTINRLNKWANIIEKQKWFKDFEFIITGSFPNIIKNEGRVWPTWDIDMILISNTNDIDYKKIKKVLIESVKIALLDCSFFLDIYYQHKEDIYDLKEDSIFYVPNVKKNERFYKTVFSYTCNIKREGAITTNWDRGEEIVEGLWKRRLWFPSQKQTERLSKGCVYKRPIFLKDYIKKYYKEFSPI